MYGPEEHKQKVNEFTSISTELISLYIAKNLDYGDIFGKSFQEWGVLVACICLTDKLNRLFSLTKIKTPTVEDEIIEDTLMGMALYSIMTLVELRRLKEGGGE